MAAAYVSSYRYQTDILRRRSTHKLCHALERLRAVDNLVRQGKIRHTASSNYEAWRLMEAIWMSDSKGLARFGAYQPQHSLGVRDIEEELMPVCDLKDLAMRRQRHRRSPNRRPTRRHAGRC